MAAEDGLSLTQETWQDEGFSSYEEYEDYYCRLVDDLLDQSKQYWKEKKQRWNDAERRLEMANVFGSQLTKDPSRSDVPILPQAVEEAIALLCESLPRPQVAARQAAEDDMASALNLFIAEELDANSFDVLMARVALDMKKFNLGVIKQAISNEGKGPLGKEGRIILNRVDPRHIWPDPFAKSWRWGDYLYLINAEPDDLGNIRDRFPTRGGAVEPEPLYSLDNKEDDDHNSGNENYFTWVAPSQERTQKMGERHRALIKECWLDDKRVVEEIETDPDGNPILDADGKPLCKYVRRYPNGRCIITCNGVLLLDLANPFRHRQPPYTFFPGRISSTLFSYGDVEILARMEDKINQLAKDAYKNLRANMNAPWIVDAHAFDSPQKFQNLTNDEGLVIIKRPGAMVQRHPPSELPASLAPFMDWLKGVFDDILGVSGVMRGQVAEGAQLSAEAIQGLQGASTSRVRLKSRLLENSLEHLGYLLQWNIRQKYPGTMQVQWQDPSTGETKEICWDDTAAQDDYAIEIQTGSSLPGAKQGAASQAILLWDHGLIDREAALSQMQFPGAATIIKRINDRETQLAELGMEAEMNKNKTGSAGRKHNAINI